MMTFVAYCENAKSTVDEAGSLTVDFVKEAVDVVDFMDAPVVFSEEPELQQVKAEVLAGEGGWGDNDALEQWNNPTT